MAEAWCGKGNGHNAFLFVLRSPLGEGLLIRCELPVHLAGLFQTAYLYYILILEKQKQQKARALILLKARFSEFFVFGSTESEPVEKNECLLLSP